MKEVKILGIVLWRAKDVEPEHEPGDTIRYVRSPNVQVNKQWARVVVPLREENPPND